MSATEILHFWFTELTEKQHFAKDAALDALIAQRFGATLQAGSRCELFGWRGDDAQLPAPQRRFAYMPYMHSESVAIHQEALRLFAQPGLESNLDFERRHLAILERFGRYPTATRS